MNVLITGSNGQLGRELAKNLANGYTELGPIPEELQGAQVVCVDVDEMDITNYDAVVDLVEELSLDVIFNCAAYTNVNGCETDSDTAFRVNALGARNLAMAAERFGAKLIHVSTDYVFSGEGNTPRSEWDFCDPQSVYGKTKYLGEQYVRDFCKRYFIVRTAWLYGYEGNNFVKTIMRIAREKGSATVVNDQFGNPTNAADLAHHLLKLAVTEQYGLYHCTGTGECSWYDFACKIVEYAGIPATVSPCTTAEYPTPAKRPVYSSLDNRMLRNTVGDEMRPWEEALRYFITHLEG